MTPIRDDWSLRRVSKIFDLPGHDLRQRGVALSGRGEGKREQDGVAAIALRHQARLHGPCFPKLRPERLGGGASPGIVQPDEGLTSGHFVAVLHQNPADDSTLEMLNGLAARLRLDRPSGDGGAFERCIGCPEAEADYEHADHRRRARSEEAQALERRSRAAAAGYPQDRARQCGSDLS